MVEEKVPGSERESTRQSAQRKKRSVTVYLAILFAVAFLLLLLAYFMQRRNNEAMIGSLRDSMNSIATQNDLIDENRILRQEQEALESRLEQAVADAEQANARADAAEAAVQSARQEVQDRLDALRLLEQLEYLVSNQQLESASELWDPALETLLPALDGPEDYAPGQLTLTERIEALKLTLFPDYAP